MNQQTTFEQLAKEKHEKHIITAKKKGFDTGYEICMDYSEKSVKLSTKTGFVLFLPSKLLDISFIGEVCWVGIPHWLYNKNYGFFNS